jgi:hypothetical protein
VPASEKPKSEFTVDQIKPKDNPFLGVSGKDKQTYVKVAKKTEKDKNISSTLPCRDTIVKDG